MDYATVSKINPGLIYASITGYGQTGPYSNRAGYDVMVEAEFGLMHITGARDGPPVKVGVAVTDLTTGLYTSNSIMAALLSRIKSGKGQHIDVALSSCQTAMLANIASSALISGQKDSGRWGTSHPSIVPYKAFKTSDGDILLGGGNDRLYGVLCTRIGKPEWILDDRFKTNALRVQNRDTLEELIESETRQKTTAEWLDILEGCGMPYAAINDVQATLTHEHTIARGMVQEIEHPSCGPIKLVNTPVKYSESTPGIRTPPPTLGQHTDEILRDTLGMGSEDIESLRREAGSPALNRPNPVSSAPSQTKLSTSTAQTTPSAPIQPSPWASQTTIGSASNSSGPSFPQFSAATAEILKRLQANQGNATAGTAAFEAKRAEVLQNYVTSDKLPTPPPVAGNGRRGRGGRVGTPLKTDSAGPTPTSKGTGRGKGRGRGGGRGGKRKRAESEESDDDSDISSSYTPLPTRTKSGRSVNKPVAFVPTIPEPTQTGKRRRSTKTILAAQCKTCHRGTDPTNNRIVFCDSCNTAYHQYCHDPPISNEVVTVLEKEWLCGPCERSKQTVIEGTDGLTTAESLSIDENSPSINPSGGLDQANYDDGYDSDPPANYPKAGNGLAGTLRPESEDLQWLVDDNFEVFSHGWKGDGTGMGADGVLADAMEGMESGKA
ncbi:transferase family III-like protein [Paraphaeosphaeria minitans]|uniref:Transferase family III-like protein n=1 Tax=Paraphaeosphaeria minitans TaxID=565426 RepID=A0A9P6GR28_9PLEO|nr:transferase family III-like protein [Paraphaeosphaeria minitans]